MYRHVHAGQRTWGRNGAHVAVRYLTADGEPDTLPVGRIYLLRGAWTTVNGDGDITTTPDADYLDVEAALLAGLGDPARLLADLAEPF